MGFKLVILFLTGFCFAQKWEVTLTSGQTYSRVRIVRLDGYSLLFNVKSYSASVPLDSIARVKSLSKRRLHLSVFTGGTVGFYCGYFAGRMLGKALDLPLRKKFDLHLQHLKAPEDPVVLFPTAVGIVLGTVLGLDHAKKLEKKVPNPDYDLTKMTLEEKVTTLIGILQQQKRYLFFKKRK